MVPLGSRGTFRIGASNKSGCPSTTREESDRASLFHAKSVGRSSSLHDPNRPSASETRDYKNWGTKHLPQSISLPHFWGEEISQKM